MSIFKRSISFLLAMIVLMGVFSPVAQAVSAEETASVNTGNMTIEGTNGFGDLLSQEIAENQEETEAADEEYPGGYTVTDLVIEGNTATVTYDTMEEATLVVALYTEDGMQMLTSTTATVSPDTTEAELTFEGNMPEYFMASAYLLDVYDFSPLCAAYDTPMYTREMQELLDSTVDDYNPEKVLNLDDDDTTNFAVYDDSTIVIEPVEGKNTVVVVDEETLTYVIENADEQVTSLEQGNIFVYIYGETDIIIVKVDTIEISGTTVSIQGGDLEIEEVFSHVKISGQSNDSNVTVDDTTAADGVIYNNIIDNAVQPAASATDGTISEEVSTTIGISFEGVKLGDDNTNVELTGEGEFRVSLTMEYYITRTYQRVEIRMNSALEGSIAITGAVKGPPIKLCDLSFDLVPSVLKLGTALNFVVETEGKIEASITLDEEVGFIVDHGAHGLHMDGFHTLSIDVKTKFEGKLFLGLELEPNSKILYGALADIKITIKGGAELVLERELFSDTSDEQHPCGMCFGGETKIVCTLEGSAKFLKMEKLSVKRKIVDYSLKIGDIYYTAGMDSIQSGRCPNLSYRLTAAVVDMNENPIEGVSVAAGEYSVTTDQSGIAFLYLPVEEYVVTVTHGENAHKQSIYMDSAQKIKVIMSSDGSFIGDAKNIFDYETFEETVDYGSIKASGYYGNNIRWVLYSGGTLTIEGQGKMDHAFLNGVPWADYRSLIKEIVIYDGVTDIGGSVFQYCENLCSVKIPNSVTEIGAYAFRNCTSLKSITIPDSVTNTWGYIFQDCTSLSDVTLGNRLTDIYDGMFQNCNSLTSIEIPDSVTSIGKLAFYECDNLSRVTIGKSVNYMGENSFTWCTKLRTIIFKGNAPTFYAGLFYRVTATAYYPANNSTWTSSARRDYEGKITWKPYNSLGDIPLSAKPIRSVELLTNEAITGIAPQAVYPGDYRTKVTKDYILKTASFTGLVPNKQYVLFSMIDVTKQDPLTPSNLLFVDQGVADENGSLVFDYVQRKACDVSYVFVCGASNKDLEDAQITFPEMNADGTLQVVNPTVCYDDVLLVEGQDYVVLGTVDFSEAGEYTCYIRGIRNYTGLVECDYTVGGHSHSFNDYVSDNNASCTNDGTKTSKCDSCDATDTMFDVGSALGHDMGLWNTVRSATCTENGEEQRNCTRCDHSERRTIAAVGHRWDNGVVTKEPTEETEGERLYTCTACGATRTESIPVIGHEHSYEAVVTAPTCTEQGYTTYTCRCGKSYTADYVDALGHAWGDWIVIQEPTTTENGVEEHICTRCGHAERRSIAKLENPFNDVAPGSFYYDPVMWAIENGITNGTTPTTFGPNDQCMRAHVVTFLWRTVGSPEPTRTDNPFVDVKPTDFYYKPVLWAVENGITSGMDATHFGPTAYCNRAQVVTFLYRTMGNPDVATSANPFADVTAGSFYEKPVLWAVENGITNGLSATSFGPNSICNRAQIVTFLYRAFVD